MRALATIAVAAAAAGFAFTAQAADQIGIATSNPGGLYHSTGSAIAKVANENGLNVTIQPATAPTQYLPVVASGDIEMGLGNLQEISEGVEGKAHFEGRPYDSIRAVAVMFPLKSGIWVRKDSGMTKVSDLKGKRVASGYTAQKTLVPVLEATLAAGGLTMDDVEQVPVQSVFAGADAFSAGEIDSFLFAVGSGKSREVDAAVGGIRALDFDDTPENLEAIRKYFPAGYIYLQEPGPAAPGVVDPTHLVAYPAVLFTSTNVPDDVVYELVKVMANNKDGMAAIYPPFRSFAADKMVADLGPLKYHPGAIKYFKEQGFWKE